MSAPLFRDAPGDGVAWVHGTDIGVATSDDGGTTFLDRGTVDLAVGWGRDTYWAPEIGWAAGQYHMYASMIRGACRSAGRAMIAESCTA